MDYQSRFTKSVHSTFFAVPFCVNKYFDLVC